MENVTDLLARYEPLARSMARRYVRPGIELEDLEQVARIGIVRGAERFDPDRGEGSIGACLKASIYGELQEHIRLRCFQFKQTSRPLISEDPASLAFFGSRGFFMLGLTHHRDIFLVMSISYRIMRTNSGNFLDFWPRGSFPFHRGNDAEDNKGKHNDTK
mgnify:CR=1 FL=1